MKYLSYQLVYHPYFWTINSISEIHRDLFTSLPVQLKHGKTSKMEANTKYNSQWIYVDVCKDSRIIWSEVNSPNKQTTINLQV